MSTRTLAFAALLLPLLALGAKRSAVIIPTFIDVSNLAVAEGSGGTTEFKINIMLVNGSAPLEADVSAHPDSADASDFVFTPVHVTLMPGKVVTVTGSIVGDRHYELNEQFYIEVSPSNGLLPPPQPGVVTIIDDDLDQAPHVFGDALAVAEGNSGWWTLQVPIRRDDHALDQPLSITFVTSGGNPVTGTTPWGDYRGASGIATFAAGEATAVVPVEINGDATWEGDTTFTIHLASGDDAVIADGTFDVTLTNDDAPSSVTIEDVRTDEGQTGRHPVTLRASFASPAPSNASVLVQVVGGTARAGEDFEGQTVRLVPPPGATSVTFAAMIIGDTTPECDEGVVVAYQAMGTGDETMKEAKLLIVNDDGPAPDAGACSDPFATRSVPVEPTPDAAAPPPAEAGAAPTDAATNCPAPADDGCGCGLAGGDGRETWAAALVLVLVAVAARRRRPKRRRA